MKVIIMAGGSGTRLWPLSRDNYPKQFIKISGESLLARTYRRFLSICNIQDIFIITNERYKFYVINDLISFNPDIEKNIILEPVARNTAPAVLISVKYLKEKIKISDSTPLFITPSDHLIIKESEFIKAVKNSIKYTSKGIVTFGIIPSSPHTGYGYIEIEKEISENFFKAKRFTEKPDLSTALKYVKSGRFLWNSGMFFFTPEVIIDEFKKYMPEMYRFYSKNKFESMIDNFEKLESISIDYAVMEKSKRIFVSKSDIGWSDIGGWESFAGIFKPDKNLNVKIGDIIDINTENSIIYSVNRKLIALADVKDLIVINTDDAILIMKRGSGEKVKDIVKILKDQKNAKAVEHTTVYRPWGSYTVLEEGERYKIKRIIVKPSHKLSNQMHYHRSEHWIVIKGTAKVIMNDKEYLVHENESIYVPKSTKHRLENPGRVDLELIEVQNGEYVGEDDIVRFDDMYGRKTTSQGRNQ